jgi:hypothetical protein
MQFFESHRVWGILVLFWVTGIGFTPPPAMAAIRQLEEAPGQVVYQSRQTLRDQHNHSWQAIAFKRILPDGSQVLDLRLVGFPGVAEIDRAQPLRLTNSLGKTLTAEDASRAIFTDATAPEPQVGQYDLAPIIGELQATMPWQLRVPTTQGEPVELLISPTLIQEWQTLLGQSVVRRP